MGSDSKILCSFIMHRHGPTLAMKSKLWVFVFLVAIGAVMVSTSQETAGETDPFVDEVLYSSSSAEDTVVLQSGRDNTTLYRYLIIDDYADSPENWSQPGFNDSEWEIGAAPFGDRSDNGVEPNTNWDTDSDDDDVILVRHKFNMPDGVIVSAELNVAFDNYCTPIINGNLVYSERNANGMEYWNEAGTESLSSSILTSGENLLAVYARDSASGWQNRQWLDLEIRAQIFEPTTEPPIFGDSVLISIVGGNHGNTSATNFTINATSNNTLLETVYFETMPANSSGNLWLEWTPELVGPNQLNVQVSCDCNDTNLSNNLLTMELTTVIYSLEASFDSEIVIINGSRRFNFSIEVRNTGGLVDNVSLTPSESMVGSWNIEFTPNHFILLPNQTQNVIITAEVPQLIAGEPVEDGFYNLSFDVESAHMGDLVTQSLLEKGRTGDVAWKWINSSGEEELYNNTNWTTLSFNDTSWKNGKTPFGDGSLSCDGCIYGGTDQKTLWEGNNYAYFRHIIDIPNIGIYENGVMTLNVATNNFGNHYINGIYIFGDLDEGGGHYADYWNEEAQISINYLNEGENVIASVVHETGQSQWFDQEIIIEFPRENLWGYNTGTYDIPLYIDSEAPSTRMINDEGFYRNRATFEIKWESLSDADDLEGYYISYLAREGSTLGDWNILGFFTNNSVNFTGQDGIIYRFKSISVDTMGNLETKGDYDTEMRVDLESPKSVLWLDEGGLQFTNKTAVTIIWEPGNNSNDIFSYSIQYRIVGNETWDDFGSFTSPGDQHFSPEIDGQYEIRSTAVDFAGNSENKDLSDIVLTFDWVRPSLSLVDIDSLTGSGELALTIGHSSENLSRIKLETARLPEGTMDVLEWKAIDESTLEEWSDGSFEMKNMVDGYTYYFRVTPIDLASNYNPRNPFQFTVEWNSNSNNSIELPAMPLKPVMTHEIIRNMMITVDENLNGEYDRSLVEYTGNDLGAMTASQYWVDYDNGRIVFGNGVDGYLPPANSSISLVYHAYDLSTTIDTTPALAVETSEYLVKDGNNVTITWKKPQDAISFIIENRKNFSTPWVAIHNVSGEDLEYHITNLSSGYHYYRIVSVDRMGYANSDMEGDFLQIFIEAEVIASTVEDDDGKISNEYYLGAGILLTIAASSAFYLLRGKDLDEEPQDSVVVSAVGAENQTEQISEEEIDESESDFSILSGSEFSKQVVFVCEKGCQMEFTTKDDEEEIMCPHCGIMGESPL